MIDVIVATNEYPALYALMAQRGARRIPKLIEVFHTTQYLRFKTKLQMLLYRPYLNTAIFWCMSAKSSANTGAAKVW